MPVLECQIDGVLGHKWGEQGVCFTSTDSRERAAAVGRAIATRRASEEDGVRASADPQREVEAIIAKLEDGAFVAYAKTLPAPEPEPVLRGRFDVVVKNADRGQVFGWASVCEKAGELVVDHEGDSIPAELLEQATYDFVREARVATDRHERDANGAPVDRGVLIESMFFSKEKQAALGIDLGQVGTWVGFQLTDAPLREAVRAGERLMFSIGGAGFRVPV